MILASAVLSQYTRVTDRRQTTYYDNSRMLHCNGWQKKKKHCSSNTTMCLLLFFPNYWHLYQISMLSAMQCTYWCIACEGITGKIPVASVSEWSNDKSRCIAEIFISIRQFSCNHANEHSTTSPIIPQLTEPFKIIWACHFL